METAVALLILAGLFFGSLALVQLVAPLAASTWSALQPMSWAGLELSTHAGLIALVVLVTLLLCERIAHRCGARA